MTIKKREYFVVQCDECGAELDNVGEGGISVFENEEKAMCVLNSSDWRIIETEGIQRLIFCDKCLEK